MSTRKKALIAATLGNAIFGFSFLFSKVALEIARPTVMVAARFTFAFVVLNVLVIVGRKLKKANGEPVLEFSLKGKPLKNVLLLSVFQPVIGFLAEGYGIANTSSAFAGTIMAIIPIMGIVFDIIIMHTKVSLRQIFCAVGTVIGVAITTLGAEMGGNSFFGILMLMITVTSGSLFYVFSQKAAEHFNPIEKTYVMFAVGCAAFVTMALVECAGEYDTLIIPVITNPEFWGCMVYLAVFSSVGAFLLINFGTAYLTVSEVSLFSNLTTVISIAAGVIILKEDFSAAQLVGAAIILINVYLANNVSGEGK